jgi:hypothetical protein
MSAENKTRYEVQKILKEAILSGLTTLSPSLEGWGVMEFAQASFLNANKIVLMNLIRVKRLGWQGTNYGTIDAKFCREDNWIEEQSWQLHILLKREENVTIETLQANDVAGILVSWFNGPGCEYLRKYRVANTLIDADQILVYNDDSELYQKRAVFTMKLQVPKKFAIEQAEMDAVKPKLMPI